MLQDRFHTFSDIQKAIQEGLSVVDLVQAYLSSIEAGKHLNAFAEVYKEEALAHAAKVDAKIKEGNAGKLAGMVIGLKDVLCHQDHGLQGSSKILSGFKSQFTGTAVGRLINEDAIIIGRQGCDEFAMGSSNENSCYGPAKNAADPERVPGGSSGASAVAVQAGMCHASIGSDTGGSVRQPGAFCGVVGLKPTYGRISRYGLIAYGSSFDCIGPITKSSEDAALLLEIMAGPDEFDSTASQQPVEIYRPQPNFSTKRIAVFKGLEENKGLSSEIRENYLLTLNLLKEAGHTIVEVEFPLLEYLLPTYYILTTAEASSNLSRYDGVRYGYRSPEAVDLNTLYKKTRAQGFGKEVKNRIMLGTFVLSANYYDAYFTKAQKVRQLIKQATDKLLTDNDFLFSPTTPTPAFKIGENITDPLAMYLGDVFTVHANLVGIPAINIPSGRTIEGLPMGVQFSAKHFAEKELVSIASQFETLVKKADLF